MRYPKRLFMATADAMGFAFYRLCSFRRGVKRGYTLAYGGHVGLSNRG